MERGGDGPTALDDRSPREYHHVPPNAESTNFIVDTAQLFVRSFALYRHLKFF